MLKQLMSFFTADEKDTQSSDSIEVAACALLLELAMADEKIEEAELSKTRQVMQELFSLSDQRLEEITNIARQRRQESADLYSFTKLITEHYNAAQRRQFIFNMWQVAYADNQLDRYEESLVRKVSELIYVPHSTFIQTKIEAEKQRVNSR